tara:strand:+ start:243 stop:680 length:438 start_codon:yes stop_codon:yes gene_type:complete
MRFLICFLVLLFSASTVPAADVEVEMLNALGDEKMVFSEKIISVDVGATVLWKATDNGHNVEFIKKRGIPDGVGKFKSKISKDAEFTFEIPGIYAYWCTPHKGMGMIGFVVVGGNTDNLETIKKVKFSGKSKKIAKQLIAEIEAM